LAYSEILDRFAPLNLPCFPPGRVTRAVGGLDENLLASLVAMARLYTIAKVVSFDL
jgi:hypothetical protein